MPPIDAAITFLPTQDLPATRRFYEQVLGLEQVVDQGTCVIFRVCGDGYWGFCQRTAALTPPEKVVLTLVTEEVDTWYEHLSTGGEKTDAPPRENLTYGIYHFFVQDPNGYSVEVQRFLRADWMPPSR